MIPENGRSPGKGAWNDSLSPWGKGEAVSPSATIQVQPTVPKQLFAMGDGAPCVQSNLPQTNSPPGNTNEGAHVARTVGCAMAPTKVADKGEAASAQAVKKGPSVTMTEIPNDEDNTSFQQSQQANLTPSVAPEETQSTVARSTDLSAKTEKVPHEWLKPLMRLVTGTRETEHGLVCTH